MGNRIDTFFEQNPEYLITRLEETKEKFQQHLDKNKKEILRDYINTFDQLFQKGTKMQKKGKKRTIAYVNISVLRSSILTKQYDLRIELCDNDFYIDSVECEAYWDVGFLFQYLEADRKYFLECARTELIRIADYEMQVMINNYMNYYFDILEDFCSENIEEITKLDSWKKLDKEEAIKITFGEYLDKGRFLMGDDA